MNIFQHKGFWKLLLIISICTASGCSSSTEEVPDHLKGSNPLSMAILYNYYSSEYKALAYQAFNIASNRLLTISDRYSDNSSNAVVVDIDETILDNSPYQAKAITDGFSYPEYWSDWCNLSKARPVPGAIVFLHLADSLGFKIFYVSNRKKDFVTTGTITNLQDLGFPQVSNSSLLLREQRSDINPNPSDKESRRAMITESGYDIKLLVGDNLGDFFSDSDNLETRYRMVDSLKFEFGLKFIVLPNAMYGNWPASLGLDGSPDAIMEKLVEMTEVF